MPRTPAVFEEQTRWRLEEEDFWLLETENHKSAGEYAEAVKQQFETEIAEGLMAKYTRAEFSERFGERAAISALAVIEDKGKIRVLHDGTHGTCVNNRIRVRDRVRMPTVREVKVLLREFKTSGRTPRLFLADVAKAHRRVKVREEDWGLQACKLEGDPDTVYVNKVGTFGVSSAAYWWARLLAMVVRAAAAVVGPLLYDLLTFADDLSFFAGDEEAEDQVMLAVLIMWSWGLPFKAAKFRGGMQEDWIGLHIDTALLAVGLSESRAAWVVRWIEGAIERGSILPREFMAALGRIGFAVLALDHDKPLLGPLYAWSASIQKRGAKPALIPWAIRLWLEWIARKYRAGGRLQQVELLTGDIGELSGRTQKPRAEEPRWAGGRPGTASTRRRPGGSSWRSWRRTSLGPSPRMETLSASSRLWSCWARSWRSTCSPTSGPVRPSEGSQRRASRTTGEMRTRPRRCCLPSGRWRSCCWS